MTAVRAAWARVDLLKIAVALGAPVVVAYVIAYQPDRMETLTGGLVVLGVVLLAARAPGRSLLVLTGLLPFGSLLLALLYRYGVPALFVRGLGSWKEALAIGVLLAALRGFRERGERLDLVDRVLLGFVAVVTAYLVFASLLAVGGAFVLPFHDRLLAWRLNAAFLLLFFAARHAPLTDRDRTAWMRVAVVTAVVVAGAALYQYLQPDAWQRFVLDTVRYPAYVQNVLGNGGAIREFLDWIRTRPVRTSSTLFSAFALGDYLLIALAIAVERLTRGRTLLWVPLATVVLALGIATTFTRAALVGAACIAVGGLVAVRGRPSFARVRWGLILLVAASFAIPSLAGTRVAGNQGANASSSEHVNETQRGLDALGRQPLGSGLGTGAGSGRQLGAQTVVSDNTVIGIGNEIGVIAMGLYVWLVIVAAGRLRRRAGEDPDDPLARAMLAALIGLTVSGLFHHVWIDVPTAWTFWAGAGLSLGVVERRRRLGLLRPAPARTRPASPLQLVPR